MWTGHTVLPTKDKTSETTVRNLYCLFSYIQDSLQLYKLVNFFAKSLYTPLDYYNLSKAEYLI